ncbi:MAG TPA: SNF2-related protein, partial [Terriglobales bacterium]|nr:SNF2-related protein [Terriglobales bacterium]
FEAVKIPDGYFDVAISNVPFGNYGVHDPRYRKQAPALTRSIHDYFFAKALDTVRPGGIVAFITSHHTLDKVDATVRKYLAARADLVGAIRLPNTAFKGTAGTEVTTDIIFLQKREAKAPAGGESWVNTQEIDGKGDERIRVNEYFARHPEMMLGQMALEGTMYRDKSPALVGPAPTEDVLRAAVDRLPAGIVEERPTILNGGRIAAIEIPEAGETKEGGFAVKDGKILVREGASFVAAKVPAAYVPRIKGMLGVRDAVRQVFRTQLEDRPDSEVDAAREALNAAYDGYVKQHGPLWARDNYRAFDGDPDHPLLLSLEDWDPDTKSAKKTRVFTERTIARYQPVAAVGTASEALTVSLNERGRIDWDRMRELTGRTERELQDELGDLVFRDPDSGTWETADAYLSGNVRDKLREAEAAAKTDKAYQRNVAALKAVQPKDLEAGEIDVRLGAPWIPKEDIRDFVAELLEVGRSNVRVGKAEAIASWNVSLHRGKESVPNTQTWGTERYYAHDLIADSLNLRTPTVYDRVRGPDGNDKSVVNAEATMAAREQQERIDAKFAEWVFSDPARSERLVRKYNDEMNNLRLREYDGSHLAFPGANPAIGLRPHQKNAVWRVMQNPTTLLAHVVGAGKTFEIVAAAMELKRVGLAKKPMIVVPNHLVEQWGAEFLRLYPAANVLVAGKEHFGKGKRQRIMARIATGTYDAVIVSHKSFEALPVSDEAFNGFLEEQIAELEAAMEQAAFEEGRSSKTVKELEKAKKRLEAKIQTRARREAKDVTLTFEELGVDAVFVDEAHVYKRLFFTTKMTRVAGVASGESARATDMFIKTRILRQRNGRVVFATGTPISNTMAEMYTMQRYLQMPELGSRGLAAFDNWA